MHPEDEKLENILADPWLARPGIRWSSSTIFVLVALFALKPLIVNRIVARAEAYASYGLYNNAVRECKKAISLDGDNMLAWNTLGGAYKNQGDIDNAVNTYLNAININSENRVAHFKVGVVFSLEQDYTRAIPHFEYLRSLGPETPDVLARDSISCYRSSLEMLSLCYERIGKPDKQQNVLEELARTYPDYSKAVEKLQALRQTDASKTRP
jgi:tetratricopeptide (TPR) repeat protein